MEIAIRNRNQTQLVSALAPSIERELDLAKASEWNLKQAVQILGMNQSARQALQMERERLRSLLIPATRAEVMTCLGKLILHYPQTNMEENQLRLLFEDYLDDLAEFPAHAIGAAGKAYRHNPENRFFPGVGALPAKVREVVYPLRQKLGIIEKILEAKPEPKRDTVPVEAWEDLKKNLGAELRAADPKERLAATIEAMRKGGASDADIEEFRKGQAA